MLKNFFFSNFEKNYITELITKNVSCLHLEKEE